MKNFAIITIQNVEIIIRNISITDKGEIKFMRITKKSNVDLPLTTITTTDTST